MQLNIEQRNLTEAHKESGQKFPDLDTQRLQVMGRIHVCSLRAVSYLR